MSDLVARRALARWVRRHARSVIAALKKSPELDDRNAARELDRMLTQKVGEDWDARE